MMTMQRRCEKTVIYFHDLDLFCAIQLFLIVVTSLVKSARCCVSVNILGVGGWHPWRCYDQVIWSCLHLCMSVVFLAMFNYASLDDGRRQLTLPRVPCKLRLTNCAPESPPHSVLSVRILMGSTLCSRRPHNHDEIRRPDSPIPKRTEASFSRASSSRRYWSRKGPL